MYVEVECDEGMQWMKMSERISSGIRCARVDDGPSSGCESPLADSDIGEPLCCLRPFGPAFLFAIEESGSALRADWRVRWRRRRG